MKIAGINFSLLGLSGVAIGEAPAAMPFRIAGTENLGPVTGKKSINDTANRWDVHGTDLGHMFWHRDKLHMVFGDTFGPFGLGGRNWRSNTMARLADPDPRNGFPFEAMITEPQGAARELLASRKVDGDEKTVIPTYGISIDERMHLHYMSVKQWGKHGDWMVGHSGIAYSDDDGETWMKSEQAVWPPGSGFEQVAFVREGDVLYTFGIGEGRYHGVRLRRVVPQRILEPDAYQFWDGADWVADAANAAPVVPGPVGELSVGWSATHGRWLMMYLDPRRHAVVIRSADRVTGPWSDAQVVVTADDYPGLYAPFIVPESDIDGDLHYTLSMWGPYNVFLMRTRLEWTDPLAPPGDTERIVGDTTGATDTRGAAGGASD